MSKQKQPGSSPKARLADIARQSGVSVSTVSLVLRHKKGIPVGTAQRVLKVAHDLGYRPRAKSLARRDARPSPKIPTLGLIVKLDPGLLPQANPFYSQVLIGIEETCRRKKINLLYSALPIDCNNQPTEVPRLLLETHADGLFLVGLWVDEALQHLLDLMSVPIVLVDAYARVASYDAVVTDNFRGAYEAANYLIQLGHRRIALAGTKPDAQTYPSILERRQGYLQALREHQLEPYWADTTGLDKGLAYAATRQLLETHPTITALMGFNDELTIAALRAAKDLGRRIPEDVSFVGFDDIDLAEHVSPALTTTRVDKVGMGRMAVQILENRLEYPSGAWVTTVLRPTLIERASAGPAPAPG